MSIKRQELEEFLDTLLKPCDYADYGPNGLQVEGCESLSKIAFAVSATADSIAQSVEKGAQALIVHHGLFWSFHSTKTLTGPFAKRVFPLVKNEVNLYGYHLPLDGHPDIGNAATLGKLIGLEEQKAFGDYKGSATGAQGKLKNAISVTELQKRLSGVLNHDVIVASYDQQASIKTVGIITGGANSEWRLASEAGLDAYITGEISEHDWHDSQEAGIHMFAGGHHATEQFGIRALMVKIQNEFDLECFYISSENPA